MCRYIHNHSKPNYVQLFFRNPCLCKINCNYHFLHPIFITSGRSYTQLYRKKGNTTCGGVGLFMLSCFGWNISFHVDKHSALKWFSGNAWVCTDLGMLFATLGMTLNLSKARGSVHVVSICSPEAVQ